MNWIDMRDAQRLMQDVQERKVAHMFEDEGSNSSALVVLIGVFLIIIGGLALVFKDLL